MSDFPEMVYKATEPEDVLPDIDAHGYLQGVYRGQIRPNNYRLRAAVAAIAYERPKFAVVASVSETDLAVRMTRALEVTGKIIEGRATEVKELPKPIEAEQVEPLDHSKPFAVDNKSRFRRF